MLMDRQRLLEKPQLTKMFCFNPNLNSISHGFSEDTRVALMEVDLTLKGISLNLTSTEMAG